MSSDRYRGDSDLKFKVSSVSGRNRTVVLCRFELINCGRYRTVVWGYCDLSNYGRNRTVVWDRCEVINCGRYRTVVWGYRESINYGRYRSYLVISWYFEPSQPQRVTSWLKTMFNLSPIYSARKISNHKLSINHKISHDINLHKTKHTQTSDTKFSKN